MRLRKKGKQTGSITSGACWRKPSDIDRKEEITPVLSELAIRNGPMDLKEYEKSKWSLVERKGCEEDGILPEVLMRCDLDDAIMSYCN